MSTIFNIRHVQLPRLSRVSVIVGSLLMVLALGGAAVGWQLYRKLTTNTVAAYFPEALALYPGDKVQIMGVRVGSIDKIEPAGDKMKVTFHYASKYPVPANASASILNPSLVASRTIQLSPPYDGGPMLADGAVIPVERTQVPVEWDQLRNSISTILDRLGPTPDQPKGPLGEVIESFADGLAGKGQQINTTLNSLSDALSALNDDRGDIFAVIRSLARFVNALHQHDQQFAALNTDLAHFSDAFMRTHHDLAEAVQQVDNLLPTAREFVADNGSVLAHDVDNLAEATTAILQPEPREGVETALHVFPNLLAAISSIYQPTHGAVLGEAALPFFANPLELICSTIQAGSRLGYQESAELCAQYLAPVLDAIKFNFPPIGLNLFSTAATLPNEIAYSEERLRPPPGYKDTTVPGIWSPDTPFSHGNHGPGWVVAPGMQGIRVQPFTKKMLTPESLAELMGGPNVAPPSPHPQPSAPEADPTPTQDTGVATPQLGAAEEGGQ
jgi:phospholipid/cholesterol/gamma-HCH transport system substrate-binding protein